MKPELYIEGEEGHFRNWWFPGSDGGNLRDAGPSNLFEMRVACVLDDGPFGVSGTDATYIPFQDPPELASTGTIADTAINTGVVGMEWTSTGNSEQLGIAHVNSNYVFTYGENGQQFEGGAWVYLEADSAVDIRLKLRFVDDAGSTTGIYSTTTSVDPETWTYLSVTSGLTSTEESNSRRTYMLIDSGINQSIGDKIYVGAAALGPNASQGWSFPTSPSNDMLDFRFTANIKGDSVIFSTRTGESTSSNGDSYHIEAVNQGFHVQTGTRDASSVLSTLTYTTATDIYEYGRWYDFRWTYQPSTGEHKFYVLRRGRWDLIDSGSVTTTTDNFSTSYGIETLDTGLLTGGTHAVIDTFGLFDGEEFGWRISEDNAEDVIGSTLDIAVDGVTDNYNNSFYLDQSGWVLNVDAADPGYLEFPDRDELDFGTGDFTVVQSFNGVGDEDARPLYHKYSGGVGVRVYANGGSMKAQASSVSFDFSSNFLDGQNRKLLVERESGVELRGFIDDFSVADATAVDSGDDVDTSTELRLGRFSAIETRLSALVGVLITFDRLLEEFEKDDLEVWISDGYPAENEPDWLREESVLYLNPNDPVQQEEYRRNGALVNLAVVHPDSLHVRYRFTSVDGISNPQLSYNKLVVDNLGGELDVGNKGAPLDMSIQGAVFDWRDLGSDWLNDKWTVSWWMKQGESTAEQHVFGQVATDDWYVRVDNTSDVVFVVNSVAELTASDVLTEYLQMFTLTYDGTNLTLFVDDTQAEQAGAIATSSPETDLKYGVLGTGANEFTGRLGPLMIVKEVLSSGQVAALFETTGLAKTPVFNETYSLSDSFDDISINWERL